ncbi:MAG: thiamine phosphate synthase [Myxococcaceae bacterium]|nr:thiamine phosphate synthase [Myxococcaceae bacterium]
MPSPHPTVLLITDWTLAPELLCARLQAALLACSPKEVAVQHRHPGATGRNFYEEAVSIKAICDMYRAPLFINGRLDVAIALGCHLHLSASAQPVAEYAAHLPPGTLISTSVHNVDEAARARGADFALLSPIFAPKSKPTDTRATLGIEGFNRLRTAVTAHSFALGGIDEHNAHLLPRDCSVATVSTVLHSAAPADALRKLLDALQR